jgi:hypothetical protein
MSKQLSKQKILFYIKALVKCLRSTRADVLV